MKTMFAFSAILGLAAALGLATASLAISPEAAVAKGCIKGVVVGGLAGHMAGHGKLGAAAGCVIGRRHATKAKKSAAKGKN